MRVFFPALKALFTLWLFVGTATADDWPQWLGPQRDSVWREQGIVRAFPKSGLKVVWRKPVALGYAGPAVAAGRVFVADYVRRAGEATSGPMGRDKLEGSERIQCFDMTTGNLLWKHEYDCPYFISYPDGPRCTPTVDGDRVYMLGAEGNLICLATADGNVLWSKELKKEYDIEAPYWGFSGHPLVDGELLYCLVGGKESVAVAFHKRTGKEVWRALTAPEPGYCPPTMIHHAGVKQLLYWHPESVNSLDPQTGKVHWSIPLKPDFSMSITAPRLLGDFLYASGIGEAAALMKLDPTRPAADVAWRGDTRTAVYCANSTPYLMDGMIYGADCRTGAMMGVRLEDGKRLWQTFKPTTGAARASHGTAFIVRHEDRFFLMSETGDLIHATLTPAGYEELGRFHILAPESQAFGRNVVWSHPAFAGKCVFARNNSELVCVSLAE